jgi:hypothetical protein
VGNERQNPQPGEALTDRMKFIRKQHVPQRQAAPNAATCATTHRIRKKSTALV